jgi:hypothetical protein
MKWFDWIDNADGRDVDWCCFNDCVPLIFDCKNCRGIGGYEDLWWWTDKEDLPGMICDSRFDFCWWGMMTFESKRYGW